MGNVIAQFHFLRPEWFWALLPAVLLFALLRSRFGGQSNWEQSIDSDLLPYLLDSPQGKTSKVPLTGLFIAWILATIAMAGPVWQKLPEPVHERQDALVIILDLTRSMYAVDVSPNRLIRAKHKLTDLLGERKEGVTGLVVFAGDAHTVTPLTDDPGNIMAMLPALAPEIMPVPGSRLTPALKRAYQLFKDGGAASGRILIVTDGIRDMASAEVVARKHHNAYPASVLAVGTAKGAPISADRLTPNGGYLKDKQGNLIIPKVDFDALREFAGEAGGRFSRMTLDDADLKYLLANQALPGEGEFRTLQRDFNVWREEGPWLLLVLLPIAALAFRRGWLWSLLPLMLVLHSRPAEASIWENLWKTPDQQAATALKHGDAKRAAQLFKDPAWRATAQYRSKDFAGAASTFGDVDTSSGNYNLGNALAHEGHYGPAIKAYDQALSMNPDNIDAAYNKKIIEKLLKQQKQQQKQHKQGNNKHNSQHGQGAKNQRAGKDGQQSSQNGKQNDKQQAGTDQQKHDQAQQQQQRQDTNSKDEPAQAQRSKAESGKQKHDSKPQASDDSDHLSNEQRQSIEQWLRRVPDDPGGLLRRKFELQHQQEALKGEAQTDDTQSNW